MLMAQQRIIFPLGINAGYLKARNLAKEAGGKLPSNVLHDEYLVRSDKWRYIEHELRKHKEKIPFYLPPTIQYSPIYYAAWANEILVYPSKKEAFTERDVVDSETGWIFPACYIPKELVGMAGAGLFVNPEDITVENGKRIVHPAGKPVILAPFIQKYKGNGKAHELTGVPLNLKAKPKSESRLLIRNTGTGVRPICRAAEVVTVYYGRHMVSTEFTPNASFGVGVELSPNGNEIGSFLERASAVMKNSLIVNIDSYLRGIAESIQHFGDSTHPVEK